VIIGNAHDVRIVIEVVLGSWLAGFLRLVLVKGILEPAATFIGQQAYRRADVALGDRLPDWPPSTDKGDGH
jgi:hypothetical protein